jgi:mono/diheme cytochrome c family protein
MGSRVAVVGLLLAAIAAVPAGCGASGVRSVSGRTVFDQECSACHSLRGTENPRRQGGDLLAFHSSRAQLTQLTAEMPARHPLDRSQLRAVVSFVMGAESGTRRSP